MTTEIIPDRPWATREYGRLRLNEAFAGELSEVLDDTLNDLHNSRMEMKSAGREVSDINRRIRRVSTIRNLLHGMMHEKGWCQCEQGPERAVQVRPPEDGVRADDHL